MFVSWKDKVCLYLGRICVFVSRKDKVFPAQVSCLHALTRSLTAVGPSTPLSPASNLENELRVHYVQM